MNENTHHAGRYTVRSSPPRLSKTPDRGYWPIVLAEARETPGEWVRTNKWFRRTSAAQIASDLRNAHHRRIDKLRVAGFQVGDRWVTYWGNDPNDPDDSHFYIWLCFDGSSSSETSDFKDQSSTQRTAMS